MRKRLSIIEREKIIVKLMIEIYCKKLHGSRVELCDHCRELADYTFERLNNCIHGEIKPACKHCEVHCYKPLMRERIIKVMIFSGPRMLYLHPVHAMKHIIKTIHK